MRKTVLAMAQEEYDFSHRMGKLSFDVEKVELEFVRPEAREGSFGIESEEGIPAGGLVLSTHSRMKVLTGNFRGIHSEITYSFDATGLEAGDVVTGEFIILSDKGEFTLPFEVTMAQEYMYSSMGPIKNLFHFTNLAKTNWEEAVSLYYSNSFADILTGNDRQYRCAYRGLSTEEGDEHCVDEFLITVHKKSRNTYELPTNHQVYRSVPANCDKSVSLKVNGWGYIRAEVEATGDFIDVRQTVYTAEDLVEGQLEIGFTIVPSNLHAGRNFGELFILTPENEFKVRIIVENNPIDMEHSANHIYKKTVARLMREYISFRLGKMNSEDWVRISSEELSQLTVKGERAIIVKLFEIQLLLTAGKTADALSHMDALEAEMESPDAKFSDTTYGYYLYLTGMLHPEPDYVDKVFHKVRKLYHKDSRNPALAWMLIYLKEDLTFRDDKRWEFLEEQYNSGISSPLLYSEAVHLLSKQPSLMVKLGEYERTLLRFALKKGVITASIGERVQFLISREREYDDLLFDVLKATYKVAPSKDLLQSICVLLMRGNCVGEEYIRWYEDAIKEEIRITQLYEFYMASVPADYKEMLPKMVMMYFAYQNHLEYDKMALLYANVFDYRAVVPEVADSYEESVVDFLKEQIKKGHINRNLIKLYKRFITPDFVDEDIASSLAPILYAHEMKVNVPGMKRVIVIHDKAVGEGKFPVFKDVAYPTIYAKDYCVLFEDENGTRYISESMVKPTPLLYSKEVRDKVFPLVERRAGILLHVTENEIGHIEINDSNVDIYETLLNLDSVTFTFKKEILFDLIRFYFERDRIRELDRLLLVVKPEVLSADVRGEILHIMVARGLYDEAFKWLYTFGMEHVSEKTTMRLISRYLERTDYTQDEHMRGLSSDIYRKGRFDRVILQYLTKNFCGRIDEMLELMRHCESFGVDVYQLTERTLLQMLYVGLKSAERENLYSRYVKIGGSTAVRKAYLAESAYSYFIGDYKPAESVFTEIAQLMREDEKVSRICRLAYAKRASEKSESEWNVPVLTTIVVDELKNNVIFPFFLTFAPAIPKVVPYTDRSFVEYRGNADSRVILHYAIERENSENPEYRKEEMDNLYCGIFVKDFILFAGDKVSYYITEETGNREQLTLSATLEKKEEDSPIPWRFELLNRAITKRERGEEMKAGELLAEYAKMDYVTKQLFRIEE